MELKENIGGKDVEYTLVRSGTKCSYSNCVAGSYVCMRQCFRYAGERNNQIKCLTKDFDDFD